MFSKQSGRYDKRFLVQFYGKRRNFPVKGNLRGKNNEKMSVFYAHWYPNKMAGSCDRLLVVIHCPAGPGGGKKQNKSWKPNLQQYCPHFFLKANLY